MYLLIINFESQLLGAMIIFLSVGAYAKQKKRLAWLGNICTRLHEWDIIYKLCEILKNHEYNNFTFDNSRAKQLIDLILTTDNLNRFMGLGSGLKTGQKMGSTSVRLSRDTTLFFFFSERKLEGSFPRAPGSLYTMQHLSMTCAIRAELIRSQLKLLIEILFYFCHAHLHK